MVDLTPQNPGLVVSQAPQSKVSPGQIAQPYSEFADALNKSGEALGVVAEKTAEQAGYNAVTRDAEGNIQVEKAPIIGPASAAYSRAVKFAALADGEADLKRKDIALRTQYRDDPQGYLVASDAFKAAAVKQYTDAGGPDLGITLGRAIDATTTQTYKGLLNESERLELQRADKSITAQVDSTKQDMLALARGGDRSSDAFHAGMDKINTLTNERVNNPRLAYPPEAAQYDRDHFDGQLKGNAFLYHIDQVYKDKGVNDDGTAKGGAANALKQADAILSDPSIKLSEPERNAFHAKAVGEIHANEALRRQDVGEARAASQSLYLRSSLGDKIAPEEVETVAEAHRAAGDPAGAARLYAAFARKPLNDDFGRQPLATQTEQLNAVKGGAVATRPAEMKLINFESGGNPGLVNKLGYAGLYQFGAPLLKDLGIYQPGAGENVSDRAATGQWSGAKWSGSFNVPGFPQVKSLQDFLANPAAQKAAFDLHTASMDRQIATNGLDKYIGMKIGGVPITMDGLHAMIHLGGVDGTARTLASGGAYNPADANGTSLLRYAALGAGAGQSNPASSMWLAANHARTLDTNAGAAWSEVWKDYTEKGIRPADAAINQITAAARATNNHDLLETIATGVDRMDFAQGQSQQPLARQQANITEAERQGQAGELSPGQRGVLKDLQTRYSSITKGLSENPIQTTVANFPDRLNTPAPLNMKDPAQLAAGLGQRGQIAQFAQQNWGGKTPPALDAADLHQVQAALDSPDVAAKAQIFRAIATLPEDVRNATLAKIGEKRPDMAVSAAAGGLMSQDPDVAQSILRGQEAIKADKGYWPTGAGEVATVGPVLDKALPAAAFSLAGRTQDNGPFEVARGMIKARYADLSAQTSDASGKLNEPRLQQAVQDVTGGVLNHNGGSLIAPARGMPQATFDQVMAGVTDNDMAGVTTLNGAPISSNYLRGSAQLESIGSGRYLVKLGSDPLKPVYAYQNANTEAPQKFVLDLRGRQPSSADAAAYPYRAGMAAATGVVVP
jgi:hypothetical protein